MRERTFIGQQESIGCLLGDAIWDENVISWEFKRLNKNLRTITIGYSEQSDKAS